METPVPVPELEGLTIEARSLPIGTLELLVDRYTLGIRFRTEPQGAYDWTRRFGTYITVSEKVRLDP